MNMHEKLLLLFVAVMLVLNFYQDLQNNKIMLSHLKNHLRAAQ